MKDYVTKTLVWAIGGERVPAYLKIRNASVSGGGSNSNIKPKKDLRDQSFKSRVRGRKEVGRIGPTYKYGEY